MGQRTYCIARSILLPKETEKVIDKLKRKELERLKILLPGRNRKKCQKNFKNNLLTLLPEGTRKKKMKAKKGVKMKRGNLRKTKLAPEAERRRQDMEKVKEWRS